MALDKAAASGVLKEFYLPVVREQLVNRNEYLAQIETSSDNINSSGEEVVLSLHITRNPGIGSRKDLEDLPAAGNQGHTKERVGVKHHYGQLQVSGPVIRAMKPEQGSWLTALESEQKGVVNDLKRDHERQLLGTSDGVIAACDTTTSSTTIETVATTTQIRQFAIGDVIDIGTVASPTGVVQGAVVSAIDRVNKTIEIDSSVSTATTDRIFRSGNGGSGSDQREVTGVQTIVSDTGTLFNVDPTDVPEWAAQKVDASTSAISEALIEELIDEIDIHSPVGVQDQIYGFTDHRQARVLGGLLKQDRRYVSTMEFKGGFKGLEVSTASGTVGLSTLRDSPVQKLYMVNTDHMVLNQQSDWEFMEEDGNVLSRIVTGNGKDGYGAVLFKYDEQTTDVRGAHGFIDDLAA